MKMVKNVTTALVSIAAVVAMTACSSDSDSGGGGTGTLETGGFIKIVEESGNGGNSGVFRNTESKYAMLYTPSDIEGSGIIESIGFQLDQDAPADVICPNVVVKMGHTSLSTFTDTFANNVEEGKGTFETVANEVNLTIPAGSAGDYFSIPLDTPLNYNGVDNLVVEVSRGTMCDGTIIVNQTTSADPIRLSHDTNASSTTGTLGYYKIHMKAVFAGGDNTQEVAGTTSGNSFPFTTSLRRTQHLYASADVNGSGPITGIAFQLDAASNVADYNATVKLGHTTLTELGFANNFADNYAAAPTVMAENVTFTIPAGLQAGDWFWVPLNGSFNYNGTDSLIVDVEVTAATATNTIQKVDTGLLNVRAYGNAGNAAPYAADDAAYNIKLRFNGATTDVITDGLSTTGSMFPATDATRQALYRASELGTAGTISKVACRLATATSTAADYANYKVTMGHTTLDELDSEFALNFDDATVVYNGNYSVPAGLVQGDWIEIPVTSFAYDGKRNLVVKFATDGGGVVNACYMSGTDITRYPAQTAFDLNDREAVGGSIGNNKVDMRFWIAP